MIFRKRQSGPPENRRRQTSRKSKPRHLKQRLGKIGRRVAEGCVLIAAIVGIVVLGRWTHTYVTTSPHFAAGDATVLGNERVTAEEIQQVSGLAPGTNIFAVSTEEAARRILQQPWISDAQVRRRLPDRITIEVQEREAIALLRLGGLYLVDADGRVFKPLELGDPNDLPVITGVDRERYEDDRSGTRADLVEALALLRLYEESGLSSRYPLSEVHLEQDGALSIYTLEDAVHVRLGRPPFRRKLRRLARLFRDLRGRQALADYVYLEEGDNQVQPDRAVVRLRTN